MFDLNHEVMSWCRAVHSKGTDRKARIDELADHLFCEVERLQADGRSEEDAFLAAIRGLGETRELASEYRKVETGAAKWLAVAAGVATCNAKDLGERLSSKELAAATILVSLFFAGLMVFSAVLFPQWDNAFVTNILIAIWFVPYVTLTSASSFHAKSRCFRKA